MRKRIGLRKRIDERRRHRDASLLRKRDKCEKEEYMRGKIEGHTWKR